MTTFYNVTLKIETSWAEKVVKSILKTWNVNDVIVCVWYIYFWIKKLKICNVKINLKCTKFTIKTKIIQIESRIKSIRITTLVLSI